MWEPLKYGEDVEYPFYMHAIGFVMSLASMLWIPGYALYYIISQRGSLRDVSEGASRETDRRTVHWKFIERIEKGRFFSEIARIRGSRFTISSKPLISSRIDPVHRHIAFEYSRL